MVVTNNKYGKTKITAMFNVLLANICYIVLIWSYNAATFRKRVVCIHAK